jgi:hypothetical protein
MDNPDHPPVMLGNHWLNRQFQVVKNDDGRAALPFDLAAGQEITLPLNVTAPTTAGSYILEFDMVQEMITWFKLKGSSTGRLRVHVRPGRQTCDPSPSQPSAAPAENAALRIHGVPRDEVIGIIESAGGRLVDVAKDGCAGPEWRSYRYCVLKPDNSRNGVH